MTTKKLKILGPYTPDHEGPFCIDDKYKTPVELKIRDGRGEYPLAGYIGSSDRLRQWRFNGENCTYGNIMNAEEVQQPHEFWVNKYSWGFGPLKTTLAEALQTRDLCQFIRTIHVREVLPGEGE